MQKYSTKQRSILVNYLSLHIDEYLSTEDILSALVDEKISESAIYRNLSSLEKDGKLKRISKAGSRKIYYQYLDHDECKGNIHISCIKCGKTTHLEPNTTNLLTKKLEEESSFELDSDETIIYGICKECRG